MTNFNLDDAMKIIRKTPITYEPSADDKYTDLPLSDSHIVGYTPKKENHTK